MPFEVRLERKLSRVDVVVNGDIDVATYRDFRDTVRRADQWHVRTLVIDLTDADFVDSSGIGVLFGVARRAAERDRELRVVVGDPHLHRLLELVRLDVVARVETAPAMARSA